MRAVDIARRALRGVYLSYLTGRAVLHVITTPFEAGGYCKACNSSMEFCRDRAGGLRVRVRAHRRPCPVHIAWRELIKAGA